MPDRPELMAIGDSIYNGTRSLTTNAEVAQLSVPAQVARAFGWDFRTPSYPSEVLFDLEDLVRSGQFNQTRLKESVLANAQAWLDGGRWSDADHFDNISIAQTTIADQSTLTYRNNAAQIGPLIQRLHNASGIDFKVLVALYEAINVSFILNPSNDPASEWANRTPLQNIARRKPKRLLVNIGINDGIWSICLLAATDEFKPDQIAEDMHELGQLLHDMKQAGQVDHIYLNLLPKPSCVANLMPRHDPDKLPHGSDYFPEYLGRLGQLGGLSGAQMKTIDDTVSALNDTVRDDLLQTFGGTGGLHFIDTYGMMAVQDNKHFREAQDKQIWIGNWRMNNVPLQSLSHKGGLYSLDNLHLTSVGYGVLARAVCAEITAAEGLQPVAPVDLAAAFHSDSLLSGIPFGLDFTNLFLNLVVAFAKAATGPKPTS